MVERRGELTVGRQRGCLGQLGQGTQKEKVGEEAEEVNLQGKRR